MSRDDPALPPRCGLNVALLFDLSFSVDGNLREVQNAGIGYVNALAGTPSSVALYTMGTHAPVNSTNNSNFPLTPVTTSANVDRADQQDQGLHHREPPPQYTNWERACGRSLAPKAPQGARGCITTP